MLVARLPAGSGLATRQPGNFLRAPLPPFLLALCGTGTRRQIHLPAHRVDVPTGQLGEVARFLLAALFECAAIFAAGGAVGCAGPRMMQNVARLEVRAVAGGLEHEVVGKVRAVVADVQASDE